MTIYSWGIIIVSKKFVYKKTLLRSYFLAYETISLVMLPDGSLASSSVNETIIIWNPNTETL